MSFLLRRAPYACFASFVEAGTSIGEEQNIVSDSWYPDAIEDIGAYSSIGCIQQASVETETEDDPVYCPQANGTYQLKKNTRVVQDVLKLSLECDFEIIHRITWGLKNKIVNATAQTPFANPSRYVEGWLIFEQRVPGGGTVVNAAIYGRLYLDQARTWSRAADSPAIRFETLYSSIATIKPNLILPA